MSENQKSYNSHVNSFLPAVLKEYKAGWRIEYFVLNPQTETMERKQIKVSRICSRFTKKSDARAFILKMVNTINLKLTSGWNPFFDNEDARMFERFNSAAQIFVDTRKKELRANTMRSYEHFTKALLAWTNENYPDIYVSVFAQNHAIRYMDYIFAKKNVGVTTYNNNVKMGRALFSWLKERCYTKQNPFDNIKLKPKTKKTRIIIPADVRDKVKDYLSIKNPNFLLVLYLVYTSLLRPNEINQLQIKHVFLKEKYIQVPSEVAKNHKMRFASMNQPIIELLERMNLKKYNPEDYLFSSDLNPGREPACDKLFRKKWDALRKVLDIPKEMQLYSFRDTGIFDMLKAGIDDLTVMQHADHHSLDMTTIYANHVDPNLSKIIYERAPTF